MQAKGEDWEVTGWSREANHILLSQGFVFTAPGETQLAWEQHQADLSALRAKSGRVTCSEIRGTWGPGQMLSVPCPALTPAASGPVDSGLGSRQEKSSRNGNGFSQDPLHPLFTSCPCALSKSEVLSLSSLVKSGRNEHCGFPRALQTGDSHAETRRAYPGVSVLKNNFICLFLAARAFLWLPGMGCFSL